MIKISFHSLYGESEEGLIRKTDQKSMDLLVVWCLSPLSCLGIKGTLSP